MSRSITASTAVLLGGLHRQSESPEGVHAVLLESDLAEKPSRSKHAVESMQHAPRYS
jgi:hypothetical protein